MSTSLVKFFETSVYFLLHHHLPNFQSTLDWTFDPLVIKFKLQNVLSYSKPSILVKAIVYSN